MAKKQQEGQGLVITRKKGILKQKSNGDAPSVVTNTWEQPFEKHEELTGIRSLK